MFPLEQSLVQFIGTKLTAQLRLPRACYGADIIGSYRWYEDVDSSLHENKYGFYCYLMWLSPDGRFMKLNIQQETH